MPFEPASGDIGRRINVKKFVFALIALSVVVAVAASLAPAQEKGKAEEQPMFSAEEMAAWEKAAAPGMHHKHFTDMAGKWKASMKMWMKPGMEPMTAEMTAQCEALYDGRYGVEKVEGVMMGMPFQGMSLSGYDNIKGKHTMVWIDNMGTSTIYSEGDCSDNCTVETHKYSYKDPATSKDVNVRMVSRMIDQNKHVLESYTIGDDGKEFKNMEITYTRM
jgi:hypothetical protein